METKAYGIDLHIHTTYSDGTRTPEETMQDAKNAGLAHIALTDHNRFALLQPKFFHGLEVIPGAEFSTSYTTAKGSLLEVHVIGLFFEGVPSGLHKIFRKIPIQRKQYLDAMISRLNHLGMSISYEELCNRFPDSNQIGRRHIAEILVEKRYAENVTEAFDRFIGNRSPYWVDAMKYTKYMSLQQCVRKICENGGFPILAHPYHYHCSDDDVLRLIEEFKEMTGSNPAGMEVYYSKYNEAQREKLLKLAEKYELYPSAASDRHTPKDKFERGDNALLDEMKKVWTTRKQTT